MKISVLSDGAWGSALAMVLCGNGHQLTIWGPFPDYLAQMEATRSNPRFLPGIRYPDGIRFEADMKTAVAGAELILLATPTQYLRGVLQQFKPFFQPDRQLVVNVAKGIEDGSWRRVSEVVQSELGDSRYVVLSGPSHAEEVSRQVPTAVVAAARQPEWASQAQQLFMNDYFRVYSGDDPIGVELGGALKNVMAIAAGIIDGMQLGDNPKAALITRGIAEMSRLGEALGGRAETFAGLSGIGDLIVTCCSGHSRNRHVGEELGRGRKLPEITEAMGLMVAEGVRTARGAYTLARSRQVETPIIDQIYGILYENREPALAIRELMTRSAKAERFG